MTYFCLKSVFNIRYLLLLIILTCVVSAYTYKSREPRLEFISKTVLKSEQEYLSRDSYLYYNGNNFFTYNPDGYSVGVFDTGGTLIKTIITHSGLEVLSDIPENKIIVKEVIKIGCVSVNRDKLSIVDRFSYDVIQFYLPDFKKEKHNSPVTWKKFKYYFPATQFNPIPYLSARNVYLMPVDSSDGDNNIIPEKSIVEFHPDGPFKRFRYFAPWDSNYYTLNGFDFNYYSTLGFDPRNQTLYYNQHLSNQIGFMNLENTSVQGTFSSGAPFHLDTLYKKYSYKDYSNSCNYGSFSDTFRLKSDQSYQVALLKDYVVRVVHFNNPQSLQELKRPLDSKVCMLEIFDIHTHAFIKRMEMPDSCRYVATSGDCTSNEIILWHQYRGQPIHTYKYAISE